MLDKVVFENNSKSNKKDNKSSIERRFFKTTNKYKTLDIIDTIDSKYLIQNPNLSEFICKMLKSYFSKPLYRREQIIFSDEYNTVSESYQKNCIRFRYTYDNKTYTVMPYKIFTGKEQMFNYVFCYGLDEESKLRNYSFRLSRMSGIQKSYSKRLKVVYSKEAPIVPFEDESISCSSHCVCPPGTERKCTDRRSIPGSVAFVPSVVGLIIAGEVIKDLIKDDTK